MTTYVDETVSPEVNQGERKIYSTDENGQGVKVFIYLKNDGSLSIDVNHPIIIWIAGSGTDRSVTGKNLLIKEILGKPWSFRGVTDG